MSSPAPTVLFDLDGVLVDSRVPIIGSLRRALLEHGVGEPSEETLRRFIGPPLAQELSELLGEPPDSPRIAEIVTTYRRIYARASLTETVVVDGIEPVLEELSGGWRLAVATSKPVRFAQPLLDALGLARWFEVICGPGAGAETVGKSETVAEALERLGRPGSAVMIGDRSHDVVGAHANGIPVIGVTWGIGDREELQGAGAEAIVERPDELPAAVREVQLPAASAGEASTDAGVGAGPSGSPRTGNLADSAANSSSA